MKKKKWVSGFLWSKEEDDKLAELHAQGMTYGDMARAMDRSYHSITGRLVKLGLVNRRRAKQVQFTTEEDAKIAEMARSGLSCSKISFETGRSAGSVHRRLTYLGIYRPKPIAFFKTDNAIDTKEKQDWPTDIRFEDSPKAARPEPRFMGRAQVGFVHTKSSLENAA